MPSPLDQPETSTPSQTPPIDDEVQIQPQSAKKAGESSSPKQKLAIEYAPPTKIDARGQGEEDVQTLDLGDGGGAVKLDKLGPVIVNSDGNWQDLHPVEQERTVRLLVKKRNLVRMQRLDQEDQSGGERVSALEDQAR